MRHKNSKSFIAGILAALMMLSLMSGLAIALSSEASMANGYKIVQMSDVTVNTKKGNHNSWTVKKLLSTLMKSIDYGWLGGRPGTRSLRYATGSPFGCKNSEFEG